MKSSGRRIREHRENNRQRPLPSGSLFVFESILEDGDAFDQCFHAGYAAGRLVEVQRCRTAECGSGKSLRQTVQKSHRRLIQWLAGYTDERPFGVLLRRCEIRSPRTELIDQIVAVDLENLIGRERAEGTGRLGVDGDIDRGHRIDGQETSEVQLEGCILTAHY